MGDVLEPLKSEGYQVFHDVPCLGGGGKFNLDHVVVGGGGVTVIETKTRRKQAPAPGDLDYEVTYDGSALVWPRGGDRQPVEQVVRNADWLRDRIKSELAIEAPMFRVLAIPGWKVIAKSRGPVIVSNGRNTPVAIRHQCQGDLTLDEEATISRHLLLMCRDVDFVSMG